MTQEQKELLFKDLCMRLPYGVKVDVINEDNEHRIVKISEGNIGHLGKGFWKECKPYLFPLSSMSEDLKNKLYTNLTKLELKAINDEIEHSVVTAFEIDFYNKHHIDYRMSEGRTTHVFANENNIYDNVINCIEWLISVGEFNKEYLEE